jgi:hypothetical protein
MIRYLLSGYRSALAAGCLLLLAGPAAASTLQKELSRAAVELAEAIRRAGEDSVAIGQFTGPPQLAVNPGPGIVKILTDQLQTHGISVKARAQLGIEGRVRDVEDSETKQLAAEISGRLVDRRGVVLHEFTRGVFGDETLPTLFGLTVSLPPEMGNKQRDKRKQDRLDQPVCFLDGACIRADRDSPYGIEIQVKESGDYSPRPPVDRDGLAFASIARDEIYAVRLINDSPHEAAVTLSIDGISMFAFSENRSYTRVIVAPHSSLLVKGWHRNNQDSDEFLVTEYSKSAAAELNRAGGDLGVITACFSAAWPAGEPRPPDEPDDRRLLARSIDGTGRGARVEQRYVEVTRQFGVIRASVSARYTK